MTSQVHLSLDVSHDSDSLDCQSASEFSQAWQRFPEKSAQSMSARILASGHGPSYSPRKPDTMKGAHLIDGGWASWREKIAQKTNQNWSVASQASWASEVNLVVNMASLPMSAAPNMLCRSCSGSPDWGRGLGSKQWALPLMAME